MLNAEWKKQVRIVRMDANEIDAHRDGRNGPQSKGFFSIRKAGNRKPSQRSPYRTEKSVPFPLNSAF